MTNKYLIGVGALCAAAVVSLALPATVKADAFPCTNMYLNQAREQQKKANTELTAAKAVLNEKQAKLNSLVSAGITSGADYLNAANELLTAKGNVEIKQMSVNTANSYVYDCECKYKYEDAADNSYKALQDLNVLQAAKLAYDNAQSVANAAAEAVQNTKNAIAGYQVQLATSPSVQAQIDALNVQLIALTADFNNKQAIADQKKAAYVSALGTGWAAYDKKPIEYVYIRDDMRDKTVTDLNKDDKVNGEDFFIGVTYLQSGDKDDTYYRQDHYLEEAKNVPSNWETVYYRTRNEARYKLAE